MRRGWVLKYGSKFKNGKEKFYIEQSYQIGFVHLFQARVDLDVDDARRIAELIQTERKQD